MEGLLSLFVPRLYAQSTHMGMVNNNNNNNNNNNIIIIIFIRLYMIGTGMMGMREKHLLEWYYVLTS